MKKQFNKIKTWLATLGITIVSLFSKVFGQIQSLYGVEDPFPVQEAYGAEPILQPSILIKLAKRPLIGITLIIGIISFIKIRKTEDKVQKGKKIRRTIITISILVILIIACIVAARLLKKY